MLIRLLSAGVWDEEGEHLNRKARRPRGKPYGERGGWSWGQGTGTPQWEGHTLWHEDIGRRTGRWRR
jgi:hypothetical protein